MQMIDRRRLIFSGLSMLSLPSASALAVNLELPRAARPFGERSADVVEGWMDEWMNFAQAPGGTLHMTRFKEPIYLLTRPIGWKPNKPGAASPQAVEVPTGFVTDFASIPRVFWSVLRPDGDYTYPAIIHDYLYWTQERPRAVADEIFRLSMQDFDISASVAKTIYRSVRVAGGFAWSSNAALKARGEKRIVKVFPTDPTTSWSDWKQRPEVF